LEVDSIFPQWIVDIATVMTMLGFFLTLWLLYEARHIRNSFLRRARLPQITKELGKASAHLSSHLQKWDSEEREAIKQLFITRALLENLLSKLPEKEHKKCAVFVKKLKRKKWGVIDIKFSEDDVWNLYSELSALTTMLIQLEKDSKWD